MKGKAKKIIGTSGRPRLCVNVSHKNICAQVIDDIGGKTLASASTLEKEIKENPSVKRGANISSAGVVGSLIGKRSIGKNIVSVVFDRGEKKYHGRIKAVADAARKEGLKF